MSSGNVNYIKKKVIFVMGATGTGKSRLAIDLALHFNGEIINSDKMQIHKGLDILTNKATPTEMKNVKHHLLSEIEPETEFSAKDFCLRAISAIDSIILSQKLPIIVGGSNSYIEALVEDTDIMFEAKSFAFKDMYDCCFIWLDVDLPYSFLFVSERVDEMVKTGLVNEVRDMFDVEADNTRGIRKSIGVVEMEEYLKSEGNENLDDNDKDILLKSSIDNIKVNTMKLVLRQLEKIRRLKNELQWPIHRIDATIVFEILVGKKPIDHALKDFVVNPSIEIVKKFLFGEEKKEVVTT